MLTNTNFEESSVITSRNYYPSVSIIEPFHPMMSAKAELEHRMKITVEKVEKGLMQKYSLEKVLPVILKLHNILNNLNYNTHRKSIAIFASPLVEKVYYLDIPVEEKIVIDDSFEVRDLVYSKKENIQYLVLLLSAERSKMYLGSYSSFILIKSNVPENVFAYKNDVAERVANFSDPNKRKEILLDKFLDHMDAGLSLILKAYNLPVFVLGPERVLGHYKKISHNSEKLVGFIHGNYNEATEADIRKALQPYLTDWQKIKQQAILQEIEKAMSTHKLAFGIQDVWKSAAYKNCRLLIVEKDFVCPAHVSSRTFIKGTTSSANVFYIKDAVDDVMEKVLQNGGDAEFVENGALKEYGGIALIQYY